jgi:putative membrane protein
VYGEGSEPDPRFTFANERTFLAWIRTALALLAAGVALEALAVPEHEAARRALVVVVIALGTLCAGVSYARWAAAERAMRTGRPLPAPALAPLLAVGLLAVGVAVLVGVLTS